MQNALYQKTGQGYEAAFEEAAFEEAAKWLSDYVWEGDRLCIN